MEDRRSLLPRVLADFNLFDAWLRVRGNRGCPGADGVTIRQFEGSLEVHLAQLKREVMGRSYAPRPMLRVLIERPGRKPRYLSIPTVRDRVLQTAVALVLTPIFEAEFEECSFAYRKGRSVQQALARVSRYREEGYRWVVDADIRSYFDEIDHKLLMGEVRELVGDEAVLRLIERWIGGEVTDGERSWRMVRGVPQGSPLSPLLANLFLDRLDEALLDEDLRLVRFADDFLVLCRSRERAEAALELTEEVLEELRLQVNETKTHIVDFDHGFRFLGVDFVRSLALRHRYPEYSETEPEPPPAETLGLEAIPADETLAGESDAAKGEKESASAVARLEAEANDGQEGEQESSLTALPEEQPSSGHVRWTPSTGQGWLSDKWNLLR